MERLNGAVFFFSPKLGHVLLSFTVSRKKAYCLLTNSHMLIVFILTVLLTNWIIYLHGCIAQWGVFDLHIIRQCCSSDEGLVMDGVTSVHKLHGASRRFWKVLTMACTATINSSLFTTGTVRKQCRMIFDKKKRKEKKANVKRNKNAQCAQITIVPI